MHLLLEFFQSPSQTDADVDLVNCVYPDTLDCLFAFHEIDEGEYWMAIGR